MDRKELFFKLLSNEFSKEGFKYIKSKNSFSKKESGNEFIIQYDTWEYFFAFETNVKILIGEIEKIKKSAWGKLYDKFVTIGNTKSNLITKPEEGIVKTDTKEKVYEAVKQEIDFYYSFIKKYFKKNLDYTYLDKTLNTVLGKNLYLAYNPIHTSFLAIIVAKLTKNTRIGEIFVYYRGVILEVNDVFIEEYDLLVEYLKAMEI